MLNITFIISASLVNPDYFGNYKIYHVFIVGNLFDCAHESLANATLTRAILQAALVSMEKKEIDVELFILLNWLSQD